MADITLNQTITGSLTSDDPKYSNGITVYDRYNFVGLDDARQLTIKVNRNLFDGFELILRNADTGKIIDYTINAIGSGGASISATTFPGVNYSLDVSDFNADFSPFIGYYNITNGFGSYTLSTVDGGKATSIVTTDKVQRNLDNVGIPRIGTVGADGKFFPLASDISASVTDVAVAPNGQFYGIGDGVFLLRIDPRQQTGDQIEYANGIAALSTIKPAGGSATWKIDAIEFANNKLYALYRTTTQDKLYTIDTTTPVPSITAGFSATFVGDLPAGFVTNGGDMVYDAANNRFLVTAEGTATSDALWQIPLAQPLGTRIDNPAGATVIGQIGSTGLTGLNFENGQLTGFTSKADGTGSKIRIDPNTGVGTIIQAIAGITNISGAATIPAATTRNDFNGDGKADILWRNDFGSVALWQMNGATVTSGSLTSVPNIDASWRAASTGDYNGDGKTDVLWRNTNGSIAVWTMDGVTVTSSSLTSTSSLDNSWKTAGSGDYNGDGRADILWRNDNGAIAVWQMTGATVTSSSLASTPSLDPSWKVAGNSDFNGDGKADILWRNDDGSVALWQMNGAAITASTAVAKLSTDWKIAGTGDFNGDSKADILWRNDDGRVALWQMNGAAITSSSLTSTPSRDSSQTIAGIGDYNGDSKADILWRKDTGAVEVWQMNGSTVISSTLTSVAADGSNWKIAAPII